MTPTQKHLLDLGIVTQEDLEAYIQNHLNYLEAEGVVKKVGDRYRMKTPREIQDEIHSL